MPLFDVRVEIAFDSGYLTPAASRTWTDVSSYVDGPIGISRGRSDEVSQVQASRLDLALDNRDGRFTPELATGAYYPDVKLGRPIRVRVRYPSGQAGNFLTANQASMETSVADWTPGGTVAPTLSQSAVHASDGTKALLITWGTGGSFPLAQTTVAGLTAGRQYTSQARVWVPAGSPNVQLVIAGISTGAASSGTGSFVTITHTWTATASTHLLQVWPTSSPTAGNQVWVDSVMVDEGAVAQTFTTTPPPFYDRYTGYVDEWSAAWPDSSSAHSVCNVAAGSRFARLATSAALRSIIEEEYALDDPVLHYTLAEPEGATSAGDSSSSPQSSLTIAQAGAGGTLEFGLGTGPGTDSLSAPVFTRASAGNGKYLTSVLASSLTDFGDNGLAFDVFFNTSSATAQTLVALSAGGSSNYLAVCIDATGKLAATASVVDNTGTTQTATATSAGSVADGSNHHGALRIVLDDGAGQGTVSLVTDGTVVTAAAITWPTWSGVAVFPAYSRIYVGGPAVGGVGGVGGVFTGTLAHVGVYVQQATAMADARFLAHADSGLTGFSGETAEERIARYASYLGIPAAEQSLETGLLLGVPHVDTTDMSALDLMQRVAVDSEDGLLFDGRGGDLTFHSRSHRYNVASALTLDASLQEVEGDFAPKVDYQGMVNDITASRPGGIAVRAVNADSVEEHGYYRDSPEILTTSDAEVQSVADWRAYRLGTPRMKAPALSLDLANLDTAKIAAALDADLGTLVTASNLPSQAHASSLEFFVEGVREVIGAASFGISWNVSPAASSSVWQLDSASFSQLDSTTVLAY